MSDVAHEAAERAPLTESETGETEMTYGHGRMPWSVALVWVVFLSAFVWYMAYYALPDLRQWGGV